MLMHLIPGADDYYHIDRVKKLSILVDVPDD